MGRTPYGLCPLLGKRSLTDEEEQREGCRPRKDRLPLQSLHLQELQLLTNEGRASQVARPYLIHPRTWTRTTGRCQLRVIGS